MGDGGSSDGNPSWLAIVGSVVGVALLAIVRAASSSPFRVLADLLGFRSLQGDSLVFLSIGASFFASATFVCALRVAWRGRLSLRHVLILTVIYYVVIVLMPLPKSGDVYSYGMYGRIVAIYHSNPYVVTPSGFPNDPMLRFVSADWVSAPDVYGPLFTLLSAGLAKVSGGVMSLVLAFKIVVVAASLATVLLVAAIAKRLRPERAPFAAAALGLNPAVLFVIVAGVKNDALVGLAIVVGLWFLFQRKELAATLALTAGMLIKATPSLPILLLVLAIVAHAEPGDRLRALGKYVAVVGGFALLAAAPFLQTRDPTLGIVELARHHTTKAPSVFVGQRADSLLCHLGGCHLGRLAYLGLPLLVALCFPVALFLIARSLLREPDPTSAATQGIAWAWALLLVVLMSPALRPWYVLSALTLVWLLPRVPRIGAIGLSVVLFFDAAIPQPSRFPDLSRALLSLRTIASVAVIGVFIWIGIDLFRRWRLGVPLDEETAKRHS